MANFVKAIPISSINSAAFTGDYDVLSVGLDNACSILRIVNDSNRDVTVSYDGVTDHDYVVAGSNLTINAQTNSRIAGDIAQFRKGLPVHVKAAAGTGFVYLAGYYT